MECFAWRMQARPVHMGQISGTHCAILRKEMSAGMVQTISKKKGRQAGVQTTL